MRLLVCTVSVPNLGWFPLGSFSKITMAFSIHKKYKVVQKNQANNPQRSLFHIFSSPFCLFQQLYIGYDSCGLKLTYFALRERPFDIGRSWFWIVYDFWAVYRFNVCQVSYEITFKQLFKIFMNWIDNPMEQ